MYKIFTFIKNNALPVAMLTGGIFHNFFAQFGFLMPYFLFVMLLLSFSRVSMRELKPTKLHFILLAIEVLGALGAYYALSGYNKILAESVMMIILCPTATAAVIITTKLGGSAASITTYTLMANITVAVVIPIFFPIIEPGHGMTFFDGFFTISKRVFPLLVCPMILAELLRHFWKKAHSFLEKNSALSFYMWAVTLTTLVGIMVKTVIETPENYHIDILMAVAAMIICIILFVSGKKIGSHFNDRISAGQAIGQKNTTFSIWAAQTYLDPLSSVCSGFYIIWQNLFNSWQLQKKRKMDEAKQKQDAQASNQS